MGLDERQRLEFRERGYTSLGCLFDVLVARDGCVLSEPTRERPLDLAALLAGAAAARQPTSGSSPR